MTPMSDRDLEVVVASAVHYASKVDRDESNKIMLTDWAHAIVQMWAEREAAQEHLSALRFKHDVCSCSYDAPGDVCQWHQSLIDHAVATALMTERDKSEPQQA